MNAMHQSNPADRGGRGAADPRSDRTVETDLLRASAAPRPPRYLAPAALLAAISLSLPACGPGPLDEQWVEWDRPLREVDARPVEFEPPVSPTGELSTVDPLSVPGDGPIALSVEQAVVTALRNNRSLAVAQYAPAIAGTFEDIERAVFDPSVFASSEFTRDRRSETSRATGDTFDVEGQSNLSEAGIRQRLPTGTTLEGVASTGRSFSNRTSDQHETRFGLTLTQALLRGFDPAANLVGIRQARLEHAASVHELTGFTEALVAEVESAYWRYALAQAEMAIVEQSLEFAKQVADETRGRIEVGVLGENEQAAADAEVALRQQNLINARSRMLTLRIELLRLLNAGGSLDWNRAVTVDRDPTPPPPLGSDPDTHVELARRYRPEVNEARVRLDQNRLEVIRTRNGLLPRLDLFVTLGKTGFAESFYRSIDAIDSEQTYDLAAGIAFEYPLGNREAEALDRRSLLARNQAAESVRNLEQLVELDVRRAYIEAQRAREQIDASAATRRLREQSLTAETEKLKVGKSTNLLVAQAQRELLVSRIAEVDAIVALKLAVIDLYRLDGTLLHRRGVQIAGAVPPRPPADAQPLPADAPAPQPPIDPAAPVRDDRLP